MPIFDGRQRYDLTLTFKRVDHVKAERGYQGQVVVCMITYEPVAGHRPERSAIKHLTQTREMEIALAPIAGTRVLAPFRVSLPTLLGPAVLQAVQQYYPLDTGSLADELYSPDWVRKMEAFRERFRVDAAGFNDMPARYCNRKSRSVLI